MRLALGAWLLLGGLMLAAPMSAKQVHPDDEVPGHPGLTYLDLVRQEVKDLAPNKADDNALEGSLPTPAPRHLGGKVFEGDTPDPVTLGWMEDERIIAGGKHRMVILADLGPDPDRAYSQTLLLLFDDDVAKPKLLDAGDVGLDKDTEFDEHMPTLRIGPGDEALLTVSEHDDADLSYDGSLLVFVRGDRFRQITHYYVINANNCGWTQRQTAKLSATPVRGSAYDNIDLKITHAIRKNTDDGCGDPPPKRLTRTFEALYRWNAKLGRFVTTSTALKQLAKLNGMEG
jgi:hypothetical protein